MTETYEGIRDNSHIVPQATRRAWIEADQSERMLRHQYERLAEDGDLTDEARSRRAGELYEKHREAIERKKREARDALVKAAKSAERSSIPKPPGEALSSTDATKLLLDQNESARIVRMVEKRANNPLFRSRGTGEFLREEYARGLEVGGVEGGSICRGVLRAAGELGISSEEFLNPLRSDSQHKSLDDSRRLEYFSGLISASAPKPPRSLEKAAKGSREQFTRSPAPLLAPASGPPISAAGGSSSTAKRPRKRAS